MFAPLACALALLATPLPRSAGALQEDAPVAEVIVKVLGLDGEPAPGIRVSCTPPPPGHEDQVVRTGADGVAEFLVRPDQPLRFLAWSHIDFTTQLAGIGDLNPLREDDIKSLTIQLAEPPPRRVVVSVTDAKSGRDLPDADVAFVRARRRSELWGMRLDSPFESLGFLSTKPFERSAKGRWEGATRPLDYECVAVQCKGYGVHVERFSFDGHPAQTDLRIDAPLQPERHVAVQVSDIPHGARIYGVTLARLGSASKGSQRWVVTYPAQYVDEGLYRFSHVPADQDAFVVIVRHGNVEFVEKLPKAAVGEVRVAIEMAPEARIRGVLRTRTGRPLAGVAVELRHAATDSAPISFLFKDQEPVSKARTRSDGSFEFEPVARGSYVAALAPTANDAAPLWVAEDVFCDARQEAPLAALRALAPAAETTPAVEFVRGGPGTIVASAKKNGAGRSCPVRAMLIRRSDGATLNPALSGNAKSRIVFGRLSSDDYSIVAVARGGWISEPTDVSVPLRGGMQTCTVELKRGATLRIDCSAVDRSVEIVVRTKAGLEYRHVAEGLTSTVTIPAGAAVIKAREFGGSSRAKWTVEAAAGETIERAMPPSEGVEALR